MSVPQPVINAPTAEARRMACRVSRAQVRDEVISSLPRNPRNPEELRGTRGKVRSLFCITLVAIVLTSCTTDRTRRAYLEANAEQYAPAPSNPVIVVPGFGVTRLFDPLINRYAWGTGRATMRRDWPDDLDLPVDIQTLAIGHDRLVPRGYVGSRGPINTGWQLTVALEKFGRYESGRTVYPFAYDWRLSAMDNARQLDAFAVAVRRDHGGAKVDIVTHSAGAIVALAWVKLGGGGAAVRNLVMIAPPLNGVIDAFRVMVRPERFLRRTFTADIVATWPFVPELLPEDGRIFVDATGKQLELDVWSPETWERFGTYRPAMHPVFAASLRRARSFRNDLRDTPIPGGVSVHVLAGDCVPTARRVFARTDRDFVFYPEELKPEESALRGALFEAGDGTIPVSSVRGMADPQVFCDGHQGIAVDPNVHRALLRILREPR